MSPKFRSVLRTAWAAGAAIALASPGVAQISFTPWPNESAAVVCADATGQIFLSPDDEQCVGQNSVVAQSLTFGNGGELETFAGSVVNLGGAVNFNSNNVQFNSSNVSFGGGSATFNNTVSFTGPSVTFDTLADFNNGITSNIITNSGNISTNTLLASGVGAGNVLIGSALTVQPGASVDLGGNIIHGVAAGIAATDAVNVSQLIAATSGITTDISALETTTATHTAQITTLQTDLTTETAARTAADVALDTRADALETTTSTHTTQISSLQTTSDDHTLQIGTLFDLRRRDRREARRGTAAAVAMSEAPMPSRDGGISYSVHGATYRGQHAIGGSLKYRVSRSFAVDAGLSHAGHKDTAARIGVSGEF